jgi:MFS transporter, MHS family, proline/betaine transporter
MSNSNISSDNTLYPSSTQTKLTREQKEAVGLLSIGTFLEYFDLMLYVHMAVLLNELFFPKTGLETTALFSAFAFCSTYVLRPFGALLFGYLGDTIGRRNTVIVSTFVMALSCIVISSLPTYSEIGITASWIITIVRMIQGISSVGEITGAQIYLTEITKPPVQYPAVASVYFFASLGSVVALTTAMFATSYSINWRFAFLTGAGIALFGAYARGALRETPDFADAKKRLKEYSKQINKDENYLEENDIFNKPVSKKTSIAMFCMSLAMPVSFYVTYIHYGHFLKHSFSYSSAQVIKQNFNVGLVYLAGSAIQLYLSSKINPLKILKFKFFTFAIFLLLFPIIINSVSTPFQLFFVQCFIISFGLDGYPAKAIFYKHFPVLKRFTYACVLHAVSHACIYVVTSFGIIYLVKSFGQLGLLIILIPVSVAFGVSLNYFDKLERKKQPDLAELNNKALA